MELWDGYSVSQGYVIITWLGMIMNTSTSGWYWSDGTYPQYAAWNASGKAGYGAGQVLGMTGTTHRWFPIFDASNYAQPFICEKWPSSKFIE
jgi:hypothetical protein